MQITKAPRLAIKADWVPNYGYIKTLIAEKKGKEESFISLDEIKDFIKKISKDKDSPYIPIEYQRFVSLTVAYDNIKPKNEGEKSFIIKSFVGDESNIIKGFWDIYNELKVNAGNINPVIFTGDKKHGVEPLLGYRTNCLLNKVNERAFKRFKMPLRDVMALTGNSKNVTDEINLMCSFKNVLCGFNDFRYSADKWENERPNYKLAYSKWYSDLNYELSTSFGVTNSDIDDTETLVYGNQWEEIGLRAVQIMASFWKELVNYRYFIYNDVQGNIYDKNMRGDVFERISYEEALTMINYAPPFIHPLTLEKTNQKNPHLDKEEDSPAESTVPVKKIKRQIHKEQEPLEK